LPERTEGTITAIMAVDATATKLGRHYYALCEHSISKIALAVLVCWNWNSSCKAQNSLMMTGLGPINGLSFSKVDWTENRHA